MHETDRHIPIHCRGVGTTTSICVEITDATHVVIVELKIKYLYILPYTVWVSGFWYNDKAFLNVPANDDL